MSRYTDTHHYHRACGHTCASWLCDPTAHTVKCQACRDAVTQLLDKLPLRGAESARSGDDKE